MRTVSDRSGAWRYLLGDYLLGFDQYGGSYQYILVTVSAHRRRDPGPVVFSAATPANQGNDHNVDQDSYHYQFSIIAGSFLGGQPRIDDSA